MSIFSRTRLSSRRLQSWERDGFLILKGCFDRERMTHARNFVDRLWSERASTLSPLTIDTFLGTSDARSGRMAFHSAPDDARQFVYKLNDA